MTDAAATPPATSQAASPAASPAASIAAFRRGRPEDLDDLLVLVRQLQDAHQRAHPDLFVPADDPGLAARPWPAMLAGHAASSQAGAEGAVFLAEVRGRLAGFVAVEVIHETAPVFFPMKLGHLMSIAVDPSVQGRGLGRALVAMAEAWAASRGASQMKLAVWTFNGNAQRLYESLGYETRSVAMGKVLPGRATTSG